MDRTADVVSLACRVGEERSRSQCAIGVRAPEIAFPQVALKVMDPDWDARSDIWSLACTVRNPCIRV